MICKSCGTESKGKRCPHCGEKLSLDSASTTSAAVDSDAAARKPKRLPPLSLKMVFWQAIALFLPLAYLFFNVFICLSNSFFSFSTTGEMHLHRFIERLADRTYETNVVGEIMELTLGEAVTAFDTVSPFFYLNAERAAQISLFVLPVLVITAFVLICAAAGVLLFLTGGRILRVRAFCNLTFFGGVGATFAPLLGLLLLRLQYCMDGGLAAADMQMQRVIPSMEAICVMGILMCTLLPALASLRRIAAYAAKERDFVCFPYRFLAKRPFAVSKIMALLAALAAVALAVGFVMLPISIPQATQDLLGIRQVIEKDVKAIGSLAKELLARNGAISFTRIADAVFGVVGWAWMIFVLFGGLRVLLSLLRVLFVKRSSLLKKKRKQKTVRKLSLAVRNTIFAPFIVFIVAQVIMCVVLLLFSPITMHLDFSCVDDTLSIVYLTIAYVRTLGATNTLYALLAMLGILFWHTADQAGAALIVRSAKE